MTEIMVNGYNRIYVERFGVIESTNAAFVDDDHLLRIIDKIVAQVGRRVDESSPMVDARLPDGSRVNAIIPPLSLHGPTLTIRKFSRDPFTIDDLIGFGLALGASGRVPAGLRAGASSTSSSRAAPAPARRRCSTRSRPSSPRTSASSRSRTRPSCSCSRSTWCASRPGLPNVEGEGEVTIRELVRNALRMRPDRIVVGEVRGAEALDMLQAMNTGHEGSLTTIHANSPRDALNRLETMVLMSGHRVPAEGHPRADRERPRRDRPPHAARRRVAARVARITEVIGMESDVVTLQDVFLARPVDERAAATGIRVRSCVRSSRPACSRTSVHKLAAQGVELPEDFYEPERAVGGRGCRGAAMSTALFDSAWGPFAIALGVGCIVLVAAMVALARPRGAWLRGRLDPYGQARGRRGGPGREPRLAAAGRQAARPHRAHVRGDTRLAANMVLLERAGSQLRPVEFV